MAFDRSVHVGLVVALLLQAAGRAASERVWTNASFEDFRQGEFEDHGANTYVSKRGRVQLVNRWDLNNDGYLDIVFSNSHSHAEKVDATIFWGNGRDFDNLRATPLPNDGAQHTTLADLDRDGASEIIVSNYSNGTWDGMDSYVYFTDWAKYRKVAPIAIHELVRTVRLPTRAAQAAAVADLNRDGHADIVFAFSAGFWEYRAGGASGASYRSPSRIYWGAAGGFDPARFTDLDAFGASDVAVADLNGDAWPDIVVANRENAGDFDVPSFVYWGGTEGFSVTRRTELPTHQVNAAQLHDIDADGDLDILFANGKGAASYVYVNDGGTFAPQRLIELASSDARGIAAEDLNGDGWSDVFVANHQQSGNPLTLSYLYWGSKEGFSPERRQPFRTTGAWSVSIADLNGDRRAEIVVSSHKEHYSYDVPSYIYWNSQEGFSDSLRTSLFTHGAVGNTVGDFDGDGHVDVMFNNTIQGARGLGSGSVEVFWGNREGQFSPDRRLELPALDPYEWAAGDLNDDGWADLVVANMDEVGRRLTENFVFWGAQDGLKAERLSALMSEAACGVAVADLDRDGFLDVIFSTRNRGPRLGLLIYWGGADGFVTSERTGLPGFGAGSPAIADLNGDGHLDLVASSNIADRAPVVYWGDGTRNYRPERSLPVPGALGASNAEVADLNKDGRLDLILTRSVWQNDRRAPSFVYYGGPDGIFTTDRRQEFQTVGTQGVTVGDIDRDGWLDVVCPNYNDNDTRATQSRIYFGSAHGLTPRRMVTLPTSSGTGSQIADYNGDGINDLLLICHRSEGDPDRVGATGNHRTSSFLYWGGRDGFSPTRRSAIPSKGAHYDSGVDLGNIYDRRFEYGYRSSPFEFGAGSAGRIDWEADEPHGSRVRFQVRTASTRPMLARETWHGPAGADSYFETRESRLELPPGHSWIQYRAILKSPNGSVSPVLRRVQITFW